MREFSWNVFAVTGNIDAYLLYKDCCSLDCEENMIQQEEEEEERLELTKLNT